MRTIKLEEIPTYSEFWEMVKKDMIENYKGMTEEKAERKLKENEEDYDYTISEYVSLVSNAVRASRGEAEKDDTVAWHVSNAAYLVWFDTRG